jgi:acetyl-CoA carboxylase carboxyl transferase beta subunit
MYSAKLLDIFRKRVRHPLRPRSSEIISTIFENFKSYKTSGMSLVIGESDFLDNRVFIIGQQKPRPQELRTREDLEKLNYGMLNADEHSQILDILNYAESLELDNAYVITFIDTYGADISMYSAQRFQAYFISHLIRKFLLIPLKTISVVLGEGGSGGALAIQVTDRRAQLEDALYATAPPESMASIVFRDATKIGEALSILKPTAHDLKQLNVIDTIIPSPDDLTDITTFSKNIRNYLEKTIRELSRIKLRTLLSQRAERAESFGLAKKHGRIYRIKKFIEKPFKDRLMEPPPDIEIITFGSTVNVADDYGNGKNSEAAGKEYIVCGGSSRKDNEKGKGCGQLIPLTEYLASCQVCPHCGKTDVMGASGWIDLLCDAGSFYELYRNMTAEELLEDGVMTPSYTDFLAKQRKRTKFKESLVTAVVQIYGIPVVIAICEFLFSGGTMGVVFGEKFKLAVKYAIKRRLPFVSVCCSGGARLYEGISALMQMVKTVNAINELKTNGLPYISILADPCTGGAIASFAALGDVIIAEPGALVIFAGPRVMESSGFQVDEKQVRAFSLSENAAKIYENLAYYHDIRGIHEIAERKNMKRAITKYLEFYSKELRKRLRA